MEVQEINEVIKSQEANYREIGQIYSNIRKDSASRKTTTYIEERKARLTEIFTRTTNNHARLEDLEELSNHKYITSDYFGIIKSLYTEAIQYLQQCEKRLEVVAQQLYIPQGIELQHEERTRSTSLVNQLFRISQINKKINSAYDAINEDKSSWYLQSIATTLQKQWHEIVEAHMKLLMEDDTLDHAYFQTNMFEEIEKKYEQVNEQLISKLNDSKQTNSSRKIKLPVLNLPIFTGTYESWRSFSDLFMKIIHEDTSLSATEKMQYLKTHIRGDAAKLIKHLSVCEANYVTAWSLITKRYNNQRVIISRHVDNILGLQKVNKPTSETLRNLHDTINENLEALKSQEIDISTWDPILTKILSKIWDTETNEKYEQQLIDPTHPQSFSEMLQFLERRFKCLENTATHESTTFEPCYALLPSTASAPRQSCWFCHSNLHTVYRCDKFRELSVQDRNKSVNEKKICKNCLMHGAEQECHSTKTCVLCGKVGHHSYLHREQLNYVSHDNNASLPSTSRYVRKTTTSMVSKTDDKSSKTTLLATAMVKVYAMDGTSHLLRVLCDQGSEASFCTEEVAQLLSLPRSKIQTDTFGIADEKPKTSNSTIDVKLQPRFSSDYKLLVTLIIIPKLTNALPNRTVQEIEPQWLENKVIADPTYYKRGPIDIILGAQEYSRLLLNGLQKMQDGLIAQNTEIGWIISGICNNTTKAAKVVSMMTRTTEVQQLNKFSELEEVPANYQLTNDDQVCENYYNEKNPDETNTVRLPFKNASIEYVDSRRKAATRLIQLERKFTKDKHLQTKYQEFQNEYLKLGHMRKVPRTDYNQGKYYFPHQPVINENSRTRKVRVVFDPGRKEAC